MNKFSLEMGIGLSWKQEWPGWCARQTAGRCCPSLWFSVWDEFVPVSKFLKSKKKKRKRKVESAVPRSPFS